MPAKRNSLTSTENHPRVNLEFYFSSLLHSCNDQNRKLDSLCGFRDKMMKALQNRFSALLSEQLMQLHSTIAGERNALLAQLQANSVELANTTAALSKWQYATELLDAELQEQEREMDKLNLLLAEKNELCNQLRSQVKLLDDRLELISEISSKSKRSFDKDD